MKQLIFPIIILLVCFYLLFGTEITFKPFSIKFKEWVYAIGWLFIMVGVMIIKINHGSVQYKKGFSEGVDYVLETLNKQMKDDDNIIIHK